MGGTLIPIGGHNLLEPAKFEKNIIVGPYIYKINEIVHDFKTKNAIVCLNSINDLNIYIKKINGQFEIYCKKRDLKGFLEKQNNKVFKFLLSKKIILPFFKTFFITL